MKKIEPTIPVLIFESFVFGCCETAAKSFFWLPDGANIFKRIGRSIICCCVADKTTKWVNETVVEGYEAVNELYLDFKDAMNESKEEDDGGNKT